MLQQRFDKQDYEIIVVSDGPDSETVDILKQWSVYQFPVLRHFCLPENRGPAAARNFGWLNARGRIVAFTDDDCLPDSHWLTEIYRNIGPDERAAITGRVIVPVSDKPTDYELNTMHLQTADFITANCACTKAALQEAGGFDEKFRMAWREDSDLQFKFIENNIPIKRVETAVVVHPVRQAAWGVSIKEQKKTMFDALLFKKYPQLFRKKVRPVSPVLYYGIIIFFMLMPVGLLAGKSALAGLGFVLWLLLTGVFVYKRLINTRRTPDHIAEMIATSMVIPFLSVYWQWYGAIKYKVLFI